MCIEPPLPCEQPVRLPYSSAITPSGEIPLVGNSTIVMLRKGEGQRRAGHLLHVRAEVGIIERKTRSAKHAKRKARLSIRACLEERFSNPASGVMIDSGRSGHCRQVMQV